MAYVSSDNDLGAAMDVRTPEGWKWYANFWGLDVNDPQAYQQALQTLYQQSEGGRIAHQQALQSTDRHAKPIEAGLTAASFGVFGALAPDGSSPPPENSAPPPETPSNTPYDYGFDDTQSSGYDYSDTFGDDYTDTGLESGSNDGGLNSVGGGAGSAAIRELLRNTPEGSPEWMRLLGILGPTALGVYASNKQSNALSDLENKYMGLGAPSRARYESSFLPGFSMENEPGYKAALDTSWDTGLRRLSATGGNPFGQPGGLAEVQKYVTGSVGLPALQEYRRQNMAGGGLAALTSAAPGAATSAIGSDANKFNALGYGLSELTKPETALEKYLRQMQSSNSPSLA